MKSMKETLKHVMRVTRTRESLESKGIKIRFERRLVKMTNVQWRGSRLHDATCHYRNRWEVSGNTYPVKGLLQKWGLKWDGVEKVWWIAPKEGVGSFEIASRILKVAAKRNLW